MARIRPAKTNRRGQLFGAEYRERKREKRTIHHITRGNHMSPRPGISQRDLRHTFHTPAIINRAVLGSEFTTMSMIGILAQADIARHYQMRELAPNELRSEDHGGLRVVGGGASGVLGEVEGHAEEDYALEAFGDEWGEKGL